MSQQTENCDNEELDFPRKIANWTLHWHFQAFRKLKEKENNILLNDKLIWSWARPLDRLAGIKSLSSPIAYRNENLMMNIFMP